MRLVPIFLLIVGSLPFAGASEQLGAYQRTIRANGPAAVRIGPDQLVFVVEQDRHRIKVFDASGAPIRRFGRFGSGPGALQRPTDLAFLPDGNLLVLDAGNQRVVQFGPGGNGQAAWGSFGDDPGQFRDPQGIATTAQRVYVADTGNHRVQIFDLKGAHQASFGSYGQEPGAFISPVAVAVADDGSVFVAEAGNSRVQRFDADGNLLGQIGDWGFFPGLFSGPMALAIHGQQLFVVDEGNHRVQVFSLDGKLAYEFGLHALEPRQGEGRLHYPDAIAVSPDGSLAIVGEYFEDRLQFFGLETAAEAERRNRIYRPVLGAATPHFGMYLDTQDELLAISSRDAHQVLLYDVRPPDPILVHKFGRLGTEPGRFLAPADVLLEPGNQRLLVTDVGNRRLSAFSLDHDPKAEIKHRPTLSRLARSLDLSQFASQRPIELAALVRDPQGGYLALDISGPQVLRLSDDWQVQHRFGAYGKEDGEFRNPTDLALSPDGSRVYVVDAGNHRIQAFDAEGNFVAHIGKRGRRQGQFENPFGIAVAADGTLFVSDVDLHRVSAFDATGRPLHNWGGRGIRAGQFLRPRAVDVDRQGRVLVVDHGNHRVQIFDARGGFVRAFGPRLYVLPTRGETVEED